MDFSQQLANIFTADGLISLFTLAILEVVLGIDNIIFISIMANKVPKAQQQKARTVGLMLALIMRVVLLFSISWVISLKDPLFTVFDFAATGRDLILFGGGVFLLIKTTIEINNKIEGDDEPAIGDISTGKKHVALKSVILQIVLIDIVFSFDSILTAVGLVDNVLIMILAVIVAIIIMIVFSGAVSEFINRNPGIKMLALAFLLMISIILIAEAFHEHIDKTYIYVSMAFSLLVEALNIRARKKQAKKERLEKESGPDKL